MPVVLGTLGGSVMTWLFTIELWLGVLAGRRPDQGALDGIPLAIMVWFYAPMMLFAAWIIRVPADDWQPGRAQNSFDKQFVRDWLTSDASGWDKASGEEPPALPADVVEATRAKYVEAYENLMGRIFA